MLNNSIPGIYTLEFVHDLYFSTYKIVQIAGSNWKYTLIAESNNQNIQLDPLAENAISDQVEEEKHPLTGFVKYESGIPLDGVTVTLGTESRTSGHTGTPGQ